MTSIITADQPQIQIAMFEAQVSSLLMKRESMKEQIKSVPIRNAQILFYAGLAVCATVYGTIFGVGPIMVVVGIVNWRKSVKQRQALQQRLSVLEDQLAEIQIKLNVAKAKV